MIIKIKIVCPYILPNCYETLNNVLFYFIPTLLCYTYFSSSKPIRAYQTGMDKGLIVVLNTSTADYFFSLRSTIGYLVGIHNPRNYPDATNGNYHQFLIPDSTETFLKLDVATVNTDEEVARYDLNKVWINVIIL